jgi:adenylosuccinate synthase
MTVTIVGTQLGDEGKGGIVDLYADDADVVARYQGGDNAGHTVVVGDQEFKLSLVPSGAVQGLVGVLGNGCVVNPRTLFDEIDTLRERGLDPDVRVAQRAHVILHLHRKLDGIEESEKAETSLDAGTTGRGIGPTYEDKAGRRGVRIGDLLDPEALRDRLSYLVPHKRRLAENVYGVETGEAFDLETLYEEYREYGERLADEEMTVDCGSFLADRVAGGENVMFEGAQGTSIDIDHGIYPYVTSSNPTAGCAATGTGLGPTVVGDGAVIGVVKAYLSRVGTGPLPTEIEGDRAERIRERGGEFGTVTGRPRRIGWLDLPMLRHAARANGLTAVVVNHVDVLAELEEVRVAHAYELDGEERLFMPPTTERWADCEPVYRTFSGWADPDWGFVAEQGYDALPPAARTYLQYIREQLEIPLAAIGVGPKREETIVRQRPFGA